MLSASPPSCRHHRRASSWRCSPPVAFCLISCWRLQTAAGSIAAAGVLVLLAGQFLVLGGLRVVNPKERSTQPANALVCPLSAATTSVQRPESIRSASLAPEVVVQMFSLVPVEENRSPPPGGRVEPARPRLAKHVAQLKANRHNGELTGAVVWRFVPHRAGNCPSLSADDPWAGHAVQLSQTSLNVDGRPDAVADRLPHLHGSTSCRTKGELYLDRVFRAGGGMVCGSLVGLWDCRVAVGRRSSPCPIVIR